MIYLLKDKNIVDQTLNEPTKQEILDNLHTLLTSERSQNRFYFNKSVSFRYELEFSEICKRQKIKTLDGGMFLLRKTPEFYFVYITISSDRKEDYSSFYDNLRKFDKESLRHLFFAEIDGWDANKTKIKAKSGPEYILDISQPRTCPTIDPKPKQILQDTTILTPKINFYEYDEGNWKTVSLSDIRKHFEPVKEAAYSKKQSFLDYMNEFPIDSLRDIYCNRFFMGVSMAGITESISDIDKIIIKNEKFILVEVKNKEPWWDEKHPNDTKHARFGWDFRRLSWYLLLKQKTGMDVQFVVAHIDNRESRNIVAWKDIMMDDWCKCADWGGEMQGNQMAPYEEFSDNFNE